MPFESVAESTQVKVTKEIAISAPVKTLSKKLGIPQWMILAAAGAILLLLVVIGFLILKRRKEKVVAAKSIEEFLSTQIHTESPAEPEEGIDEFLEKVDAEKVPVTLAELAKLVPGLKIEDLKYEPESVKVDKTLNAILKHIESKVKEDPKKAAEIIRRWLNS